MEIAQSPDTQKILTSDKREKILQAALLLFTTMGFHATPTSQISKEAGVSTGTLFHYFPDKNTLIDELYLSIKKEMSEVLKGEDDELLPVKTRLERGFERYIRWGIAYPEKARFLMQFHHSPNISAAIHSRAFEEFRWMKDIYMRALEEGVFTNHPLHFHMVMTLQILNGIIELLATDTEDLSAEEIISAGIEKLWK